MRSRDDRHTVLRRWLAARPAAALPTRGAPGRPAILRDIARIRALGDESPTLRPDGPPPRA